MLQYLLNATAIWLTSLVMFDVFLRKESYHSYNRFYLLFTFLSGAFLPLLHWQENMPIHISTLQKPVQNVITIKQNIIATASYSSTLNLEQWLLISYFIGMLVATILLAIDVVKLATFFSIGTRSEQETWTIIETGKKHAPFSFLHTLFVCSRDQYSTDEWNMILQHEKRHTSLFHIADILLMQLARIIFWFHPLVYMYNKRLLLIHEYQADNAAIEQRQKYGRFLLEQAILQSAPSLSHSLNRSPVKKRILMLTRTSSMASKMKMLVFIPLAVVCTIFFSQNSFSQKFEKNGNTVTYRGNKFEMSLPVTDTQILVDPVTGKEVVRTTTMEPVPIKMNGIKVYNNDEVTAKPYVIDEKKSFETYLLTSLSDEFNKLSDGIYYLDVYNVVVGTNGHVVYYEYDGLSHENETTKIPVNITAAIDKKIDALINKSPVFSPGKVKSTSVIVWTNIFLRDYKIKVGNHQSSFYKK